MLKTWLISGLQAVRTKYKRAVLFFAAIAMVFSLGLSVSSAQTANAQPAGFGESISTCAIQQVGWVICPVMRTVAQLADFGFAFINENFLRIEYDLTTTDSGIYTAWELIRNIANIVLVLAFLYIVYTQITGRNTGDFNLKRILPRLVIGAILLNLSYYVCAFAIQLSNIVGSAVLGIMVDVADRIGTPAMSLDNAANGFEDGILTDLVTAMLQKQGVVWVMLAPMATITIAIATVSAIILVLLIARKVVVSMLVLVSPLLFVAYLLPNLERFFQQWVRLFVQLLLLYPVIAFLLGTGQIVSATIMSVGSGGDSTYSVEDDGYQARSGGSGSATTDLAAAGAAVLPLIGVWWMMKGLSAVMSSAGTKLSAGVGRGGRARERAEKMQAKFGKPTGPTNANSINIMGGKVNVYDRKPAFSRVPGRRRRASAGGSSLPLGGGKNPEEKRPNLPQSPLSANVAGELSGAAAQDPGAAAAEAAKKMDDFNAANISADKATASGVQAMVAGAEDKAKKTANDVFKNLNQRNKPQSPDAQRQFGTAMPAAGGGGGGGGAPAGGGGSAGPSVSNHANDYRAPQIAQTMNTPQHTTSVTERIVAVPVQSNLGATLGGQGVDPARVAGHHQAASNEVQEKAKGIVNKYLFESARDVDEASKKLDELSQKHEEEKEDKGNKSEGK